MDYPGGPQNDGLVNVVCNSMWMWFHDHLCRKCKRNRQEAKNHIRCHDAGLL